MNLKIFLTLLLLSFQTFALPPALHCKGQVEVAGYKVDKTILLSSLNEGAVISLSSPITLDIEPLVRLTLKKALKTKSGLRILATYDELYVIGFMTFEIQQLENGETVLVDLKGFEGDTSFGPSTLVCDNVLKKSDPNFFTHLLN